MSSGVSRMRKWGLLALIAGHAAIADAPDSDSSDTLARSNLDMPGVSIGTITIINNNVFDLENPAENKALYRVANRIHITTRKGVIEEQLLFQSGDQFSSQRLDESERLLRSNRYIQSASIKPTRIEDGLVDVDVTTIDSWSFQPELSLSRSGGVNKLAVAMREVNLLGTGMGLEAQYRSEVDRDTSAVRFWDRNFGHSRYAFSTYLANNSDGHATRLSLAKPFYSLHTRDAKGFSFVEDRRIGSFYDLGEQVAEYNDDSNQREIWFGWSKGLIGDRTTRYTAGITLDEHHFSEVADTVYSTSVIPEDRKLLYPFIGIERVEDRFEKTSNRDQINREEDRFLGTRLSARLGLAGSGMGSDRNAWIFAAAAQTGFGSSKTSSLLLATAIRGRIESGTAANSSIEVSASYHHRQSDHRLFYTGLTGTFGSKLDLDQHFELGGDNGLRGYPLRYQTGENRVLLAVEQRYFTDWFPFRLFNVGAAVFFDVGRAWGTSPVDSQANDWLKDVGFGLRIGNTRSGLGRMFHIDVAFPLDGGSDIADVQLLVSTRETF